MFNRIDLAIIDYAKRIFPILSRFAIFLVYFWFGILKVLGHSPAGPLVTELMRKTLPSFITPEFFLTGFGYFEMLIGLVFLIPGFERLAIALLLPHMVTTALPLILLPAATWSAFLVPTLEGQYIIKNMVIIALASGIGSQLRPWREKS